MWCNRVIYIWRWISSHLDIVCHRTASDMHSWYIAAVVCTLAASSMVSRPIIHDDVIKWKQFSLYWPFLRGIHRSPVNSPQKGQWRGALMFPLISVWTNGWVNSRGVGDLRRHRARYDVSVIFQRFRNMINNVFPSHHSYFFTSYYSYYLVYPGSYFLLSMIFTRSLFTKKTPSYMYRYHIINLRQSGNRFRFVIRIITAITRCLLSE